MTITQNNALKIIQIGKEFTLEAEFLESKGLDVYHKSEAKIISKHQLLKELLGYFDTPHEAYLVWLTFKLEQSYILAATQTDKNVAKALTARYELLMMQSRAKAYIKTLSEV